MSVYTEAESEQSQYFYLFSSIVHLSGKLELFQEKRLLCFQV